MRRGRRGSAAVELAIVLPLLAVWLLGTVELARAVQLRGVIVAAAHDGARAAGRWEGPAGDPTAEILALAEASARAVLADAGVACGAGCSVVATPRDDADGRWVAVEVTVPYTPAITTRWPITALRAEAVAPRRRRQ